MEQTIKLIRPKSNKEPKTTGLEWLCFSFNAFNGSGYANYDTPEEFVQSYIDYCGWKKRTEAVALATEYYQELYDLACHLIENSSGASVVPSEKQMRKFQIYLESQ
jgi:hypothetical protein